MSSPSDTSGIPLERLKLERLKRRKEFVRLSAQGHKFVTSSFILLAEARPEDKSPEAATAEARIGFTVTKKLGHSPHRNRIRRRLREAIRQEAPALARPGWDYVLIARKAALLCPYSVLLRDVRFAFPRVGKVKPTPKPPQDK